MSTNEFMVGLAKSIADAFQPLQDALKSTDSFGALLMKYGWQPPLDDTYLTRVAAILDLRNDLQNAIDLLDSLNSLESITDSDIENAFDSVSNIIRRITDLSSGPVPDPRLPSPLNQAAFWQTFPLDLIQDLFANYLEYKNPAVFAILHLLGIIDESVIQSNGSPSRIDYRRTEIHWDRLVSILQDPSALIREIYGWGKNDFDHQKLLQRLERIIMAFGFHTGRYLASESLLNEYYAAGNNAKETLREVRVPLVMERHPETGFIEIGIRVLPIPPKNSNRTPSLSPPSGFLIGPYSNSTLSEEIALGGPFVLRLRGGLATDIPVGIEVRPNNVAARVSSTSTNLDLAIELIAKPNFPWILIGSESSHRLQLEDATFGIYLTGSLSDPELRVSLSVTKLSLMLDFSDGDSFIQEIVGAENQGFEFSGSIVWSSKTGLHFGGNAGLRMNVPINRSILAVKVDSLSLGLEPHNKNVDFIAGLTGSAKLGPLIVAVDNVGIKLSLKPVEKGNPPGLFGDLDLKFGFKPPDGLGLEIDDTLVNGGGYLYLDAQRGEYAGILNLEIKGIAVTAIGILNTKRPDGQPGFSLLIIISSEFQPIQLGLGFRLNGVGGILGLNRTVAVEVLREGIKNRTLDSVLFPKNPIQNAPKIISDLKRVFPDAEGRFIFGPMAKIGWGAPTVIVADVGLVLEVPDPVRLVILGKIRAALPREEDRPLIQLNMDVLGTVDFEKSTVSIDATLYDSRLLLYTLSGDMALRVGWGTANPLFALSVGGFNPRFQPPPGFPTLSRLQVSMGVGNNPRLNLQAYLAITSNTVQFGALLELYAEALDFNIKGHLGFDCLFQFEPFGFIADISAAVAFRHRNKTLAAVYLEGTLSGPTPWRVQGKASITLPFGYNVSVSFDQQWGDASQVRLPEINVWEEQLKPALEDPRNWSAVLPPVTSRSVGYRNTGNDPSKVVVVDPFGSLTIRQKVAPLNQELTKFGNSVPSSGNSYFYIKEVSIGDDGGSGSSPLLPINEEKDLFAPAQFRDMSDDQKLAQPEFELMESGISIGARGAKTASDAIKEAVITFETKIIDLKGKKEEYQEIKISSSEAATQSEYGALKRSRWWNSGEDKYFPDVLQEEEAAPAVIMEDEYFVIADKRDLTRQDDIIIIQTNGGGGSSSTTQLTKSEADAILNAYIKNHPEDKDILQVVPAYEVMVQAA
jgi:hypothetical protein